jgi:hypothetical protein
MENRIEPISLVFVDVMTYITLCLFKNRKSGELYMGYTRLQLPIPRFIEKKYGSPGFAAIGSPQVSGVKRAGFGGASGGNS